MKIVKNVLNILLVTVSLVACNNSISNGMSKEKINKKYKNELICSFSNLMFIDSKDYDLFIELNDENKVSGYKKYDNVEFTQEAFDNLDNSSIEEVISEIGLPSFCGYFNDKKALFYIDDLDFYYILLEEKNNGIYMLEKCNGKEDSEWFFNMTEPLKKDKPDKKLVDKIYRGMPIENLYFVLGRPEKDVGSGGYLLEFELNTGEKLYTVMAQNKQKYEDFSKDNIVQSCHFLEIFDFYIK